MWSASSSTRRRSSRGATAAGRDGRADAPASPPARRGRAPAPHRCGPCATPPTMTPTRQPRELPIGAEALRDLRGEFACRREHQRARRNGAPAGARRPASRCRIGSAKAAVLPVPVWAMPSRSRPCRSGGMACCLDGGGVLIAFALDSAQKNLGQAEVGKFRHELSFGCDRPRQARQGAALVASIWRLRRHAPRIGLPIFLKKGRSTDHRR